MNSPAAQLVVSPTWGPARERAREEVRPRRVRFGIPPPLASDATGAALVLGGSIALWASFLLAVW
jgi:hypothetical protein